MDYLADVCFVTACAPQCSGFSRRAEDSTSHSEQEPTGSVHYMYLSGRLQGRAVVRRARLFLCETALASTGARGVVERVATRGRSVAVLDLRVWRCGGGSGWSLVSGVHD